ncbi:MAG: hypothetical protein K6D55_06230 [Prevotella sp.]|nr:hypothetical protein [Prevotella sp.]
MDKEEAEVGYILAENGKFYKTISDVWSSGKRAVALVVAAKLNMAEEGTAYTGLALALQPTAEKYEWGGDNVLCYNEKKKENILGCDITLGQDKTKYNGLAITQALQADVCPYCNGQHPVFQAAKNFNSPLKDYERELRGYSQWFVPTTAQYALLMESFGVELKWEEENYSEEGSGKNYFINNVPILHTSISEVDFNKMARTFRSAGACWKTDSYWTANRYNSIERPDKAWNFAVQEVEWPTFYVKSVSPMGFSIRNSRNDAQRIWPMLAF